MPYGDVEKIAKLLPPPVRGRNISISQALEQVADLRKRWKPARSQKAGGFGEKTGRLRETFVGSCRGVVISPKPLHE
jgi:DNA polymerase-3 subunit alpha